VRRSYIATVAGFLWLIMAVAILLAMLLAMALASPAFVILALIGVIALGQAALLFVLPPSRRLFLASAVLGLVFALVGVRATLESRGAVLSAGPIMVVVAVSLLAALVSAIGARTTR